MGKTGPTPADGSDPRRRAPGPQLQDSPAELPAYNGGWLSETVEAYQAYQVSEAARLLREEDVPAVTRLFARIDKLNRMWDAIPDDPEGAEKGLRSIRLLDSMIARQCAELGIGPLARARLGMGGQPRRPDEDEDEDFLRGG